MSFNFITFVNNRLTDGLNNRSKLLSVLRNSDVYAKSTTWRRKFYETNKLLLIDKALFYPITLEGRRGTTDEFATIPFHLDLFSAALVELAKSIPVHSLILSSHLFFCLPLFVFPFIVPCRIVFAEPEDMAKPS